MQRDVQVRRRMGERAAVVGFVVLALAGCTSSAKPEAIEDPRPSTTTTAPPAPAGDPDDVVWQEFTNGGFVPEQYTAGAVPQVTIYRDGRIFTKVADPEVPAGPPAALELGQVPSDALDAFLADAAASGLIDPDTDFGAPGVTDQPSTTVRLHTSGAPQQVDVYALGFRLDSEVGAVSPEQAARRTELEALTARAAKLGEGAEPYLPERVRASRFDPAIVIDPPASGAPWPGPPLSAFPPFDDATRQSCLVIEGDDAGAVYRADQANPETTWSFDGEIQTVIVVPLLPGQEGCPPS